MKRNTMRQAGTAAAIGAGLLWGSAVVVPRMLGPGDPAALALGRFLWFGLLAAGLLTARRQPIDRALWPKAAVLALAGHVGYYLLVVLAVDWIGAGRTAGVLALLPAVVTLAGSRQRPARPTAARAGSIALLAAGLALLALPGPHVASAAPRLAAGYGAALAAVAAWAWYSVANSALLAIRPDLAPARWTAALGTAALGWVLLGGALLALRAGGPGPLFARLASGGAPWLFATLWLGFVVSWGGAWLWNAAAARLPLAQAAPLATSEPLAGLALAWLGDGRLPQPHEVFGVALVLAGAALLLRAPAPGLGSVGAACPHG